MPGKVKKAVRKIAQKAKGPAKRILDAAKREAKNEMRQAMKGALVAARRHPLMVAGASLAGHGDYVTNSLMSGSSQRTPSFGRSRVVMSRRESLGIVYSSSTAGLFSISKYTINPGLASTFPWLSNFTSSFESYKPLGIVFEFKSTSGESVGSTNTALGSVVMGVQYNSYAADPTTRIQLEGFPGAVSVAPFQDALCGVECKVGTRPGNSLLIRNALVASPASGTDSLFDVGDFFIATEGCQGTSVALGELWVTYKIELFNPVTPPYNNWNSKLLFYTNAATDTSTWANGTITQYGSPLYAGPVDGHTFSTQNVVPGQIYKLTISFTASNAIAQNSVTYALTGFTALNQAGPSTSTTVSGGAYTYSLVMIATANRGTVNHIINATTGVTKMLASFEIIPPSYPYSGGY